MSSHPSVNFGQSESGLFSPEEIARLMESEYRRSLRYSYPLSLLCAEIDRLESLHDLYGVDSEQRILRAVAGLVRSSTRASDVLGMPRGTQLVVLLPHTRHAGAQAIAGRLLAGCRELEFRGDGRALRASLSIGSATRSEDPGLAALMEQGQAALEAAQAAGGDRCMAYDHLPRPPQPRGHPVGVRSVEVRPATPELERNAPAPLPGIHELPGTTLAEKVKSLFALGGMGNELQELEREVLEILERTLGVSAKPRSRAVVLAEMHQLEERIAQQKRMLEASEEELAHMLRQKSVDPGVASIYRTAQGLDPEAKDYARKKELLAVIYQANVELLRQLEREVGEG